MKSLNQIQSSAKCGGVFCQLNTVVQYALPEFSDLALAHQELVHDLPEFSVDEPQGPVQFLEQHQDFLRTSLEELQSFSPSSSYCFVGARQDPWPDGQ